MAQWTRESCALARCCRTRPICSQISVQPTQVSAKQRAMSYEGRLSALIAGLDPGNAQASFLEIEKVCSRPALCCCIASANDIN